MNPFWRGLLERMMRDKPNNREMADERDRRVDEVLVRAARAQARVRALETEIRVVKRSPR